MSILANNLKLLRTTKGKQFSSSRVSEALEWCRSTLSGYESGIAEPNSSRLLQLSNYYGIAVDRLLRQDLTKLSRFELEKLMRGYDARVLRDMMGLDMTHTS
jgi:transcriptional regulator with XRE-family HTH domain